MELSKTTSHLHLENYHLRQFLGHQRTKINQENTQRINLISLKLKKVLPNQPMMATQAQV